MAKFEIYLSFCTDEKGNIDAPLIVAKKGDIEFSYYYPDCFCKVSRELEKLGFTTAEQNAIYSIINRFSMFANDIPQIEFDEEDGEFYYVEQDEFNCLDYYDDDDDIK